MFSLIFVLIKEHLIKIIKKKKSKEFTSLLFTVTATNGFYSVPFEQKWFETGL